MNSFEDFPKVTRMFSATIILFVRKDIKIYFAKSALFQTKTISVEAAFLVTIGLNFPWRDLRICPAQEKVESEPRQHICKAHISENKEFEWPGRTWSLLDR